MMWELDGREPAIHYLIRDNDKKFSHTALIINQAHLRRVMREYVAFFSSARPHQGIDQQIPLFPSQSRNERSGAVSERVGWHHL